MADVESIGRAVCDSVDSHGYAFQHAVGRRIRELSSDASFRWYDPIMEFPIKVGGLHSRIDLLVRHKHGHRLLVVECKRTNPAFGAWVFFEAPPAASNTSAGIVFAEQLHRDKSGACQGSVLAWQWGGTSGRVKHLGLVLKRTDVRGDPWSPEGSGKDALEHACTQVMLGLNGFLSFAAQDARVMEGHSSLTVLPVIITTAQLYSSELRLADADVSTGSISTQDARLTPIDWLIYHYPQGHGVKHGLSLTGLQQEYDPLLESLYREYVRPVAVVSPEGLEPFLRLGHWL